MTIRIRKINRDRIHPAERYGTLDDQVEPLQEIFFSMQVGYRSPAVSTAMNDQWSPPTPASPDCSSCKQRLAMRALYSLARPTYREDFFGLPGVRWPWKQLPMSNSVRSSTCWRNAPSALIVTSLRSKPITFRKLGIRRGTGQSLFLNPPRGEHRVR